MVQSQISVKAEDKEHSLPPAHLPTGLAIDAPASNHMIDDPTLLSALLGNGNDEQGDTEMIDTENIDENESNDEIIREIDVFISPELAQTMNLVQFPLQPASHTVNTLLKNKKHQQNRSAPPPVPVAAKVKPQHAMLELTYKVPKSSISAQRQVPEVLNLSERIFSSQNIPITTHMALGRFDSTGSKLDLVPLQSIQQMRPSFRHVDAIFDDETGEEEQKKAEKEKDDKASKPIMFKKPENERVLLARRSSYAFKKANEEAEEWVELEVFGPGSEERKATIKKIYCPADAREKTLRFMKGGRTGGSDGFVRSLNYLPSAVIDDVVEDFKAGAEIGTAEGQPEWMKDLTSRVVTLLEGKQGVPVSFPIIRSRFHSSISDVSLIQALSAAASLVRGNFVLKSSLLPLSLPVANARDVILILMIKHGLVRRELLIKAYELSGEEANVITSDVINCLLNALGKRTTNGMEMKLDDDMTFETKYCKFARLHEIYWEKKEKELEKYIQLYEVQVNPYSET